jgi:hypothetical protein
LNENDREDERMSLLMKSKKMSKNFVKALITGAVFLSALLLSFIPLNAVQAGLVPGTFISSCGGSRVGVYFGRPYLASTCNTAGYLYGTRQVAASVYLRGISNYGGRLSQLPMPGIGSSFNDTCRNFSVAGNQLSADCKTGRFIKGVLYNTPTYSRSVIALAEISNHDGRLEYEDGNLFDRVAVAIANGHAFEKHVITQNEFGPITREQFKQLILTAIQKGERKVLNRVYGDVAVYWLPNAIPGKGMVVFVPPAERLDANEGTAFVPTAGKAYYDNLKSNVNKTVASDEL